MNESNIVLYHDPCTDGFGAAFAAWLALGDDAQYVPCQYGRKNEIPDLTDKSVYILDYHFDLDIMIDIESRAKKLVLLDHHKTAQEALQGFTCRNGEITFDLERSGAMMAWHYFHPCTAEPPMFAFIQDRDLWRWKYAQTADFLSALSVLPFDFKEWQEILAFTSEELREFIRRGQLMNVKMTSLCDEIVKSSQSISLLGHMGLGVNTTSIFSSDVGSKLSKKSGTFGLCWNHDPLGFIKVSLRSEEGFNAAKIAEQFGGGGHEHSCAFRIKIGQLENLLTGTLRPC